MNSSFLYYACGLYQHKCLREEYKGNTILLHIESKQAPKRCPKCCHLHLVKNGFRTRDFVSLPIGGKKVILRMKVRRYKCKCPDCDYDCRERIPFAFGNHSYTRRFARYVVYLLKGDDSQRCSPSLGHVVGHRLKVMKRVAYGFRDERYFELRLYALHDGRITPIVG